MRCRNRISIAALRLCFFALISATLAITELSRADEPRGTAIRAGDSVNLLKAWPEIAQAPQAELATIECLIKPDAAAVTRPRSFVITLSNRAGADVAGLSMTMKQGAVRASVFAAYLDSEKALTPDKWSHIALTVNTKTINKQACLWIDGKLVAEELVLEPWPKSFEVAEMLSDRWRQGRQFSGELGDVRISKTVRYTATFQPPRRLTKDNHTALLLEGGRIPLGE